MKCPYCNKTAPAKLDPDGVYWTMCTPCGMRGRGDAGTTTQKTTKKAKKPRSKKSKPTKGDHVTDADLGEDQPNEGDMVHATD